MNTRLQVEHPVTEAITGQDLVEWQLRIASGEPLPLTQDQIAIDGWATEARLYAENPATGFLPSTGLLERLRLPDTVRVDTGVVEGDTVTPFYDPMIAKLIAHAPTRAEAAARLAEACGAVEVWPVRTNAGFLARAAADPDFVAARIDTGFIARHPALVPTGEPSARVLAEAAAALTTLGTGPWAALSGLRLNAAPERRVVVAIDGAVVEADLSDDRPDGTGWRDAGGQGVLFHQGEAWAYAVPDTSRFAGGGAASDGAIVAPMPGRIVSVAVAPGEAVVKGQTLLVLEAMKMEQALAAPLDGVVGELNARAGDQITEGTTLARVDAA